MFMNANIMKAYYILKDVVEGRITRYECRGGLCNLINCDMLTDHSVFEGYKYWSGMRGYCVYVGETTEESRRYHDHLPQAIEQFHEEEDLEESEYGDNDPYWEARLELARHWINFIETKIVLQ
ncbi:hypothetical protein Aeh1ORF049c [Aeromonas phage Aeh1]|uniref:Uncharacterized protein n=1 Tax=Aeromonas phage Aeh1 TaxID=2880362 RepID=Q76Z38_9CAUD|nr:hypothetical protein Aeh1p053 [Aeromonas phage Aeh1]AAQ17708.1 hypothetical protein Aeh1ORF049c [Aeromonas phage Aeh1]